MENKGRNSIAGRAAILRNGDITKPNQLPGQRSIQNYERQMAGGGAPVVRNNGNAGTRQMELNLKVSPPPSKPTVERKIEFQTKSPVLNYEEPGTISADRLQEAIIWSEILGKPLSKRKRR